MACSDLHRKMSDEYLFVIHMNCSSTSLRNVYFCCVLLLFLVDYALIASSLVKYFVNLQCVLTIYLINWIVVLVPVRVGVLPQADLILPSGKTFLMSCCQLQDIWFTGWVLIFVFLILFYGTYRSF